MSDENIEFEDEAQDQAVRNPVRARMRELEAENKRKDALLAEAEQARRELAFLKAGVNPENPMTKYFIKGYDGELSTDAIRAAAEEANVIQSSRPTADEQKAWSRVGTASRASDPSEPPVDYEQRIRNARSADEVFQLLAQARAEAEKY
jgi:hypothetical protein